MKPDTHTPYTQFARDVWANRFLFYSVIGGFVSVFPLICGWLRLRHRLIRELTEHPVEQTFLASTPLS